MKVSLKNNRLMLIVSVVSFLLSVFYAIRRVNYFYLNIYLVYSLLLTSEIAFLFSLIYLTALLKFERESRFILTSFYIFVGLSVVIFISSLNIIGDLIGFEFDTYLNIIAALSIFYLTIIMFFVKSSLLRGPFRIYAITYIISMIFDFGIPILLPLLLSNDSYFKVTRYIGFVDAIPLGAIIYIIYKAGISLNKAVTQLV